MMKNVKPVLLAVEGVKVEESHIPRSELLLAQDVRMLVESRAGD